MMEEKIAEPNQKETASLNTLSRIFDIPLWTLRKYASERRFPGIIKRGRNVYVDLKKFRAWLYEGEVQIEKGGKHK
jgi:hypothetical protein